jgi:hypothetical protein
MKKGVEVYQDLGGEGGGAASMVDLESRIIAHDERIGGQGFGTVGTAFRQTRNPCPQALFGVSDEHDVLPLSCVSLLRLSQEICKKSIPILPDALAHPGGLFSCNGRVPKYVPPS